MKIRASLLVAGALAASIAIADAPARPLVYVVTVRDAIHPASAAYVERILREAGERGASLVVLKLETPGGLVTSTEQIIEAIKASPAPVAVFVSSTKAASAGFLITLASDFAAMAPGTRIGAAHPVGMFGQGGQREDQEDSSGRSAMEAKVESDIAAFARTLAQNRGRNVEAAESAVLKSVSFTEREALEQGLIDAICNDVPDLLQVLEGKLLKRFDGRSQKVEIANALIVETDMTFKENVLSVIANPTLAFFLLGLGVLGIYVEFTHPGLVLPGVVGAICLLLFAFAAQVLPVNVLALLLILGAIVLFILEVNVASYGMLTVAGIALMALGALMLFDAPIPEMRVPLGTVLPVCIAIGIICTLVLHFALSAQRQEVTTGREGLELEIGTALSDLNPRGRVFVHGEYWDAVSRKPIRQGQQVRVRKIERLLLEVEPANDAGEST
ncbi:MAG: nodulation protein NfeD [Acidobacteriota bacterium]